MYIMRQRWAIRLLLFFLLSLFIAVPIGVYSDLSTKYIILSVCWILSLCYSIRLLAEKLTTLSVSLGKMAFGAILMKSLPGLLLAVLALIVFSSVLVVACAIAGTIQIVREYIHAYQMDKTM